MIVKVRTEVVPATAETSVQVIEYQCDAVCDFVASDPEEIERHYATTHLALTHQYAGGVLFVWFDNDKDLGLYKKYFRDITMDDQITIYGNGPGWYASIHEAVRCPKNCCWDSWRYLTKIDQQEESLISKLKDLIVNIRQVRQLRKGT